MKFSISVVCHNAIEHTKRCLEAVVKGSSDYELILTDNASSDGTLEYFQTTQWPCPVKIIHNEENLGFLGPQNEGLKRAEGEYYIVLNNDIEVPPGWLEAMEERFSVIPNLAIVGVKGVCTSLTKEGMGYAGDYLEYVEGSCLMIVTKIARQHGLFSEDFKFGYYEDSDLSLRLRKLGYKIAQASIGVKHERAVTAKNVHNTIDIEGYRIRNSWVFANKWKKYLERKSFAERILIKRAAAVGDVLLLTPVLRAIRETYPSSEIDVVSMFPDLFRGNPNVYRRLLYSEPHPGEEYYDKMYNLDLAYEREPSKHIVEAYADACGVAVSSFRPELFPNRDEDLWAVNSVPRDPFIAFHTGITLWPGRNWAQARFQEVGSHFRSKGYKIVLVGNAVTPAIGCEADLRGKTTVHTLYSVLKQAKLFIGIDSLPMHLAVAAGIPIVAVFGCIAPEYRLPPGDPLFRGMTAEGLACLGCHHFLPAPRVSCGCLRQGVYCMDRLKADRVIAAAEELLLQEAPHAV